MVYNQKYDNGVRQAAKQGGAAEAVLEQASIAEAWQLVEGQLANEDAERKAALKTDEDDEDEQVEEASLLIKGPNAFAAQSPMYWKSVAFQTVRRYITLQPEPRTHEGVVQAISQCPLKTVQGDCGESSVIVWLDIDMLGETMGPAGQPLLRKQFQPNRNLLSKLLHSALIGRGSQKQNQDGETTKVVAGDLCFIHCGFERAKKECKALFQLSTGPKSQACDTELKETVICFDDDSIRSRKKRVKGSYSSVSTLLIASSDVLSQSIPDRSYEHHPGSCLSNMIGLVQALPVEELWHVTRTTYLQS